MNPIKIQNKMKNLHVFFEKGNNQKGQGIRNGEIVRLNRSKPNELFIKWNTHEKKNEKKIFNNNIKNNKTTKPNLSELNSNQINVIKIIITIRNECDIKQKKKKNNKESLWKGQHKTETKSHKFEEIVKNIKTDIKLRITLKGNQ